MPDVKYLRKKKIMAPRNIQPGGNRRHGQHGQENFNHEHKPDFTRDQTSKHQYEDHDAMTDDAHFSEGHPSGDTEMDFRDKENNLEDESNQNQLP